MEGFLVLIVLVIIGIVAYKAYKANQLETSEERTVKSLPPTVQHTVAQMDTMAQNAFFNEYQKKKKKVAVAYMLWLIGFHYIYVRKVGLFFAYWITGAGIGFWALADLFRMPSIVRTANEESAREALQTLSIGQQFKSNPSAIPRTDYIGRLSRVVNERLIDVIDLRWIPLVSVSGLEIRRTVCWRPSTTVRNCWHC